MHSDLENLASFGPGDLRRYGIFKKMKMHPQKNKYLPILLILILFFTNCTKNESNEYIIEIMDENGLIHEKMALNHNDIKQIGLDERRVSSVGVKIVLSDKVSENIINFSTKHTDKRLNISRGNDTLISAIIKEPMESGNLFINFHDKNDALKFINSFGREPDFHLQYTKKELDEAEEYLKPGRNPFSKKSWEALLKKEYASAERNAIKAIESEPNEPSHYLYLGYIYHEMKKPKLEIKQLLKAKSLVGPSRKMPGLFLSLGQFYSESGDFKSAIDTYEEYLSKHGSYLLINEALAKAYENEGAFDSALNQYTLLSSSGDTHFENIGIEGKKRLKEHNKGINSD